MSILENFDGVFSDKFYEMEMEKRNSLPRIYQYQYTIEGEDNVYNEVFASWNENSADRFFHHLQKGKKYRIESRGSNGVLNHIAPDCLKFYKRILPKQLVDDYNAFFETQQRADALRIEKEAQDKVAKREQAKEQKRNHAMNLAQQTMEYLKKLSR